MLLGSNPSISMLWKAVRRIGRQLTCSSLRISLQCTAFVQSFCARFRSRTRFRAASSCGPSRHCHLHWNPAFASPPDQRPYSHQTFSLSWTGDIDKPHPSL